MTDIIWKPIPDYEGLYEVSNSGWVETGRLLRKEVSDRCCKCYTRHDI